MRSSEVDELISTYFEVERVVEDDFDDCLSDPPTIKLKRDGQLFCSWDDSTHINYPEDMTWDRTGKFTFLEGLLAGLKLGRDLPEKEMKKILAKYKMHEV